MQISITEAYWTKEENESDDGTEKGKRTKKKSMRSTCTLWTVNREIIF